MTDWWVSNLLNAGDTASLAAWVFWVIVSITLHELGHGVAALWQGDDTPRTLGHMTINPIVHMGWLSIIVFVVTGYAWGQMPVNPSRFRSGRLGDLYVSGAGPAVNLILAFLCLTTLGVLLSMGFGASGEGEVGTSTAQNLLQFLNLGGTLNLVLFVLNLLPVPPLDGSTILASLSHRLHEFMHRPFVQQAGFFVLVLVVYRAGVTGRIQDAASTIGFWWIGVVRSVL